MGVGSPMEATPASASERRQLTTPANIAAATAMMPAMASRTMGQRRFLPAGGTVVASAPGLVAEPAPELAFEPPPEPAPTAPEVSLSLRFIACPPHR